MAEQGKCIIDIIQKYNFKTYVSPRAVPCNLNGGKKGETDVGLDAMHFKIWQVVFIFF